MTDGALLLLTVAEAAGLLLISSNLAYELVAQGRMPHVYAQCAGMGSLSGAWAQRRLPEVKWWWPSPVGS